MIEILAVVDGDGTKGPFTAGLVLWDDVVVETAPILRYMKRWPRERVRAFVSQKNWTVSVVHQIERERP